MAASPTKTSDGTERPTCLSALGSGALRQGGVGRRGEPIGLGLAAGGGTSALAWAPRPPGQPRCQGSEVRCEERAGPKDRGGRWAAVRRGCLGAARGRAGHRGGAGPPAQQVPSGPSPLLFPWQRLQLDSRAPMALRYEWRAQRAGFPPAP